ncbi:serine hydrolase [Yinghuangia aomiensis]
MQKLVQQVVDELVESGAELGIQVAVYRHGELVVDAVAGVADPASGRPVASDTPFFSASTAKGRPRRWRTSSPSAARWTTTPRSWSSGRSSARTARTRRPSGMR